MEVFTIKTKVNDVTSIKHGGKIYYGVKDIMPMMKYVSFESISSKINVSKHVRKFKVNEKIREKNFIDMVGLVKILPFCVDDYAEYIEETLINGFMENAFKYGHHKDEFEKQVLDNPVEAVDKIKQLLRENIKLEKANKDNENVEHIKMINKLEIQNAQLTKALSESELRVINLTKQLSVLGGVDIDTCLREVRTIIRRTATTYYERQRKKYKTLDHYYKISFNTAIAKIQQLGDMNLKIRLYWRKKALKSEGHPDSYIKDFNVLNLVGEDIKLLNMLCKVVLEELMHADFSANTQRYSEVCKCAELNLT